MSDENDPVAITRPSASPNPNNLELVISGEGFNLSPSARKYYKKLIPVTVDSKNFTVLTLVANHDDVGPAYHDAVFSLGQVVYDAWRHGRSLMFSTNQSKVAARAVRKNLRHK